MRGGLTKRDTTEEVREEGMGTVGGNVKAGTERRGAGGSEAGEKGAQDEGAKEPDDRGGEPERGVHRGVGGE